MLLRMFVDFHLCTCNQIAPVAACVSLMEFCYMNPNGTETGQNLLAQHTRTLYLFMILENFLYKLCFHDVHKYSDLNHVSEDESSIQLIILKVSSTSSKRVALNCGLNSVWERSSASNMKVTGAAVMWWGCRCPGTSKKSCRYSTKLRAAGPNTSARESARGYPLYPDVLYTLENTLAFLA